MHKLMLIFLLICFLTVIPTKAENASEEIEKKAKPVSTAIGGGKAFEEKVIDSDDTGDWTQDEINYFQNKDYVGDKRIYTEEDLIPPYIGGPATKEATLRYLRLLRNELFARSGYKFNSKDLAGFFKRMSWYKITPDKTQLNSFELKNVTIVKDKEEDGKVQSATRKTQDSVVGYKEITLLEGKFYIYIEDREDNPGPKEFAMMMWEGEPEYPLSFAVSKDGKKLYLLDTFNDRLQIFSSEDGRLLGSVKVKTFKMADSIQIRESQKSWNTLGFAFPAIKADSLFLDSSGDIVIVGKERVSSTQKRGYVGKPLCYKIDKDDYSVNDLSDRIRTQGKIFVEPSLNMMRLKDNEVKFSQNRQKLAVSLLEKDEGKEIILENNGRAIETDIEILGKVYVSLDKNNNLTIADESIDKSSDWNIKLVLNVYSVDSQNGQILKETSTKVDFYSSKLCADAQGNIYYWERIPREGRYPHYESKGWRVVKLH